MTLLGIKNAIKFGCTVSKFIFPSSNSIKTNSNHVSKRLASTYRAAVLREFGEDFKIEDIKRKKLKPDEVSNVKYFCSLIKASFVKVVEFRWRLQAWFNWRKKYSFT